ncbi:MAG: ASKHA domain-containing protein, partial [Caldilineales bacterium]|nr:ASKHA domain-containing protein [Caldilineales bacterium]
VVVDALNDLIETLCAAAKVRRQDIVDAVIVGNTAMHHLLLGLPTEQLAVAPFVPAVADDLDLRAREVGLHLAPGAYLHILPNIAGFVGADHVAMLLATEHEWQGRTAVALDIGTNTEISLVLPDGRIRTVSCASGPAFEGYHIRDGMRAQPGAVERVRIDGQGVHVQTIAAAAPVGICGSGILDAVAQLYRAGILNEAGRMVPGAHPRVREQDGQREFVLVEAAADGSARPIGITQHDVREIQLAKASIQTGIALLLAEGGVAPEQIERFIIAGAFGAYIDVANAVAIGMFPDLPLDRFRQVGNAAGIGAKLALLSTHLRRRARELRRRVAYLELATHPHFARLFARSCRLRPFAGVGAPSFRRP